MKGRLHLPFFLLALINTSLAFFLFSLGDEGSPSAALELEVIGLLPLGLLPFGLLPFALGVLGLLSETLASMLPAQGPLTLTFLAVLGEPSLLGLLRAIS